jgi:hypothetical protein
MAGSLLCGYIVTLPPLVGQIGLLSQAVFELTGGLC